MIDREIDYLLAVARYHGITNAAKALYITPSALSRYVSNKEHELGVQLFNRRGKRLLLTEAGIYYIEYLNKVKDLHDKVNERLISISNKYNRTVRLGIALSFSDFFLEHISGDLYRKFPHMQLIITEKDTTTLFNSLSNGDIDAVLSIAPNKHLIETTKNIIIGAANQVIACGPKIANKIHSTSRPGFPYPFIEGQQLIDYPSIVASKNTYFRERTEQFILSFQNHLPSFPFDITATRSRLIAAQNNLGWTLTLDAFVKLSKINNIQCFSFGKVPVKNEIGLFINENNIFTPEFTFIVDKMKSAMPFLDHTCLP